MSSAIRERAEMNPGSLDYRTFMSTKGSAGFLDIVAQQFADWLRLKKRIRIDPTRTGTVDIGSKRVELTVLEQEGGRSLHARLDEVDSQDQSIWTSELLASDEGWLNLEVSNSEGRFVSVPVLAKLLMQSLSLGDGTLQYTEYPMAVGALQVPELIGILTNPDRTGDIFVAGSDAEPAHLYAGFKTRLESWAKELYGIAQVVILNPEATELFNQQTRAHGVRPWHLRTFHPRVRLGDPVDAHRHRFLTPASLAEWSERRVRESLGRVAREQTASRPSPPKVVELRRKLARHEQDQLLQELQSETEAPTADSERGRSTPSTTQGQAPTTPEVIESPPDIDVAGQAAEYLRQITLVKSVLGLRELSEQTLQAIVDLLAQPRTNSEAIRKTDALLREKQNRIEHLEDELTAVEAAAEDLQLELAQAEIDSARTSSEARWLRRQLQEAGAYESAYGPAPDEAAPPNNFVELLSALPSLADGRLVFTGDTDEVARLDDNDTLGRACRAAWDACLALADFLRAKDAGQTPHGFSYYLEHTPPGFYSVPPRRHAQNESGATQAQYGHERIFPVPSAVAPTGAAPMNAHFKLAQIGRVSPRMHYLEDWSNTKKVYIGYIGRHLRIASEG